MDQTKQMEGDLFLPYVDPDDITQEAELLRLQGKIPSRKLIQLRLAQDHILSFSRLGFIEEDVNLPWGSTRINVQAIEDLTVWALTQATDVQKAIWTFLESPNPEEALVETLTTLQDLNIQLHLPKEKPTKSSLAEVMMRSLPATKEELITIATDLITTKRPDSTVRQFLRRKIKQGHILEIEGTYYDNTEEDL